MKHLREVTHLFLRSELTPYSLPVPSLVVKMDNPELPKGARAVVSLQLKILPVSFLEGAVGEETSKQ